MEFLAKWLLVASVQTAATMSPGPAFVLSVRNALRYGKMAAVITALGLALGVGVHVAAALGGMAYIIAQSVLLFNIIKYAGAGYLIYIGIKGLMAKKGGKLATTQAEAAKPEHVSFTKALLSGFLTNLLNPKALIFFTAVFAQFIDPDTPMHYLVIYGATSMVIEFTWFVCVGLVLNTPKVRALFTRIMHWIERTCGGLMVALGLRLVFTKSGL